MTKEHRILVFCFTGLGNLILKIPLFKSIRKNYPNTTIDIITGNENNFRVHDNFFLITQGLIDNVYQLSDKTNIYQKYKYLIDLRKNNYDLVLFPFDGSPTIYKLFSFLFKGKKIMHFIIFPNKKIISYIRIIPYYFITNLSLVKLNFNKHESELNLDLLLYDTNFHRDSLVKDANFIKNKIVSTNILTKFKISREKYVVIQPMAADGSMTAKVWSPKKVSMLIDQLTQKYPHYSFVLVGHEKDQKKIENDLPLKSKNYINTLGGTTNNELIDLIRCSRLVISNDSSVMHIGSSLNQNQIALYGPTDINRTAPLGNKATVITSKTKYTHAMQNFKYSEKELSSKFSNYELMDQISVQEVIKVINDLEIL